ncbi:MAG TPA: hypothetical protein VEZ12_23010, partial [Herpetosiphonaceae bacterium]|nr:hypothetical protein [Herpetosiphonaceae bacterium]
DLVTAQESVRARDVRAAGRLGQEVISPLKPSPRQARADEHSVAREQPREQETAGRSVLPDLHLIGHHERTWILASGADRLYVIDQHRAHERVLYERLLQEGRDQPLPQHEVVPQEVVLPPPLADLLAAHRRELAAVGVAVTPAATGRLVVSAAPPVLDGADMQAVLIALGACLDHGGRGVPIDWRDRMVATIACHSSIRPGQVLSFAEMQALLDELQQCARPELCPHNHAVMATITTSWLEQQLERTSQAPLERQESGSFRTTEA